MIAARSLYAISTKTKVGLLGLGALLFLYWLALFVTAPAPRPSPFPPLLLLALVCVIPAITAHFTYVTVDRHVLSVPRAIFFRRSIPIAHIVKLQLHRSGLGFLKAILITYWTPSGQYRTAMLPSFSAFGTIKTHQIVEVLKQKNASIEIEPQISAL